MKYFLLLLLTITTSGSLLAQGLGIGQPVKDFTILADYSNTKAVAVIFLNQSCPNSRLYENRLSQLASNYAAKGVTFLFINPAISMEEGNSAAGGNTNLKLLPDNGQKISQQFGATKTPEAFLLQNVNGSFVLKYKGAIDDNPQLESSVKEPYLRNALDAVLANKAVAVSEKRALGCMIKRF
ncbi:thioredoxin-like domain-containing protein [Adhaeribacter rhizoryzae]|uniref:Redoxin domain-containing protein n=1 Tax=Adhaeribacter rhizoryzae TaxID=2607907 RepID=A0A5M6DTF6_9BACT|nr:thioredoxin-like domain-containing protein [Adhaeribacter rhizoryzae]KAA5548705.1 redoxin domain-containing protein [Adhaeribacter rhizoryzae]